VRPPALPSCRWRQIFLCLWFGFTAACAQAATTNTVESTPSAAAEADLEQKKEWSFALSASAYFVPNDREYVQPTVAVDRDWLHLEARYNYEDLETGSTWLGWNFSGGKKLTWEFTPMLGGVFGNTTGIAPGYKGSLAWWKFDFYSEGEYVVDPSDVSTSFFYNWSELAISPWEWLRLGMVTQRTRVYETDRDVQRGVFAGVSYKWAGLTAYVLNPDESRPTVVTTLTLSF
jgi:hypothetical protein